MPKAVSVEVLQPPLASGSTPVTAAEDARLTAPNSTAVPASLTRSTWPAVPGIGAGTAVAVVPTPNTESPTTAVNATTRLVEPVTKMPPPVVPDTNDDGLTHWVA